MKREMIRAFKLWNRAIMFIMVIMFLAAGPLAAQDNALLRVNSAWHEGEISLKQAVMLKADILYNPHMFFESSPFRPEPGEGRPTRVDRLEFLEEVYQVYEELSPE
jgi:hypothetical protein